MKDSMIPPGSIQVPHPPTTNTPKEAQPQTGPYQLNGWVCPTCHYVWALWIRGCDNCNRPIFGYSTGTEKEVKQYDSQKG